MALNYCWSSVLDPVCRGYILNEMTGRTIKLNSATYNKLVANGHVVDRKNGVLTPPSKAGEESDDTDIDQQPSYTPSRSAKSRLSSGRAQGLNDYVHKRCCNACLGHNVTLRHACKCFGESLLLVVI